MLVLSRQINESIMIGDTIEVTIVDVKGDKVRVGISAPKDVPVHRKEIYLAILQENLAASQGADINAVAGLGELFGAAGAMPGMPHSSALARESGRSKAVQPPKKNPPHGGPTGHGGSGKR